MENINTKVNNYDLAYNKNNSEYQNSTINNDIETMDFDNAENSMENINFNNEEYIKLVDEYKRNLKLQKEGYEKELEELDKTLAILEYRCGTDYREWVMKYKNKYDINELIELSKELKIGNIENTKAYLEQIKQDKGVIESAIYKIEQLDKTAEYDYLEFLDEYKNYEGPTGFSDEELNKIDYNELFSKVYEGNLESYCNAKDIDIDKINLQDFYDKAIKEYEGGYKTYCQDTELANLYELGNEDIIKKYNYYLENYGKEKASEYLANMKDTINEQIGAKRASEYLSTLKTDENGNYDNKAVINYLSTILKGGGTGFNSFFEGLEAWFQNEHVYSTSEYETMYILQALKENESFTNILDNTFELSQSAGNMLPSMMIGAMATPLVGTITMGVSSGGNSYHSAMVNGSSRGQAIMYGVLSGVSETTLQHFLGSIPGLNDVNVTSLKTYLQSIGKEGLEEFVQEYVDASLRESILQEEIDGNQLFWDSLKSFLYGAIMSAGSNGVNLAINTPTESSNSEVKTVESTTTTETKSNANTKTITGEIAKANYHTEKGRVCSINIDGIDSISTDHLNMIKYPNSVSFRLPDGSFLSYNELLNLKTQTSINNDFTNNIDIKETVDNIKIVIDNIDYKHSTNPEKYSSGIETLERYAKTGDTKLITRDNNCRSYIESLSPEIVAQALNEIKNKKINNLDIINQNNSNYKYSNYNGNLLLEINDLSIANINDFSKLPNKNNLLFKLKDGTMLNYNDLSKVLNSSTELKRNLVASAIKIEDHILRAKKLYIELNKKVHYDMSWLKGNNEVKKNIFDNFTTFENLNPNNTIICKGWSELYVDLLITCGFDKSQVKILGKEHKWVEIDLGDGNILSADATELMNGSIDLASCKAGMQTNGFMILNKKDSGMRLRKMYNSENNNFIEYQQNFNRNIDNSLGYCNDNGYLSEQINIANNLFADSTLANKLFGDKQIKKNVMKIFDAPIPENMDGYELYAFNNLYKNKLLGENSDLIKQTTKYMKIGNSIEPINYMSYLNDKTNETIIQIYSKSLGKIRFKNEIEAQEYLKKFKGVTE